MNLLPPHYDILVIGAGPAGQKAAVQGAKAGRRVLLVDREAGAGGECVHRGTIPSKTLRESALYLAGLKQRAAGIVTQGVGAQTRVESLMRRLDSVLKGHERYIAAQLERNEIETLRGRARFLDPHAVEITGIDGTRRRVEADVIVIATGSRPRTPPDIEVDHEHILDSDSILSLIYLPQSLAVLGSGVIACEFATIFQALGVKVTMIDKSERPLAFLDPEITSLLVRRFHADGGRFVPGKKHKSVAFDGISAVSTVLECGEVIRSDKVLVALGRTASLAGLELGNIGLAPNERGFLSVDAHCRTSIAHIYAAGDVIGPPALAASSMEQGRRAARHALGLDVHSAPENIPAGIYTIPEISSVGLSEAEAEKRFGHALVGRAKFEELARGQINGETEGLLKLVAEPSSGKVLGAQILGEGATELIHLAQMAIVGGMSADVFVDNIFNFPTMAEAYRVAALDIAGQASRLRAAG